jgi:hypothetical protein
MNAMTQDSLIHVKQRRKWAVVPRKLVNLRTYCNHYTVVCSYLEGTYNIVRRRLRGQESRGKEGYSIREVGGHLIYREALGIH